MGNYRMHACSSSDIIVLLTRHIVSSVCVLNCTRFKLNGLLGVWLVDRYWLISMSMFIIEHATFKDCCPNTNWVHWFWCDDCAQPCPGVISNAEVCYLLETYTVDRKPRRCMPCRYYHKLHCSSLKPPPPMVSLLLRKWFLFTRPMKPPFPV